MLDFKMSKATIYFGFVVLDTKSFDAQGMLSKH